jgi:hypothetical protein
MKEYDTYTDSMENLTDGAEIELVLRNLNPGRYKYENKRVKAIIFKSLDKLPDADRLWIRSTMGELYPEPWAIKILAEFSN